MEGYTDSAELFGCEDGQREVSWDAGTVRCTGGQSVIFAVPFDPSSLSASATRENGVGGSAPYSPTLFLFLIDLTSKIDKKWGLNIEKLRVHAPKAIAVE